MVGRITGPKNFRNRLRRSPLLRGYLPKSGNFFYIFLGPHSHPSAPIDAKFCTAKRTKMPVGPAKIDLNWCNESPLRGEKPYFWPASKSNTGSLPLRGILPVTISTITQKKKHKTTTTKSLVLSLPLSVYSPWSWP